MEGLIESLNGRMQYTRKMFSKTASFPHTILFPVCHMNKLHMRLPEVPRLTAVEMRSVPHSSVDNVALSRWQLETEVCYNRRTEHQWSK